MTKQVLCATQLTAQIERYLGLESMEVTGTLLNRCGSSIDASVLPLLKQRLQEEEARIPSLMAHGYIRISEKSKQLVASLLPLIASLEQTKQENNV